MSDLPQRGPAKEPAPKDRELVLRGWTLDDLPDADVTLLIRTSDDDQPIWIGHYDGEAWRDGAGEVIIDEILGWMHLEDAAAVLDHVSRRAKEGA